MIPNPNIDSNFNPDWESASQEPNTLAINHLAINDASTVDPRDLKDSTDTLMLDYGLSSAHHPANFDESTHKEPVEPLGPDMLLKQIEFASSGIAKSTEKSELMLYTANLQSFLDTLRDSVGFADSLYVSALHKYAETAAKHKEYDDAIARALLCYHALIASECPAEERVLQSLQTLGKLYQGNNNLPEALQVFVEARRRLLDTTPGNLEPVYDRVLALTGKIIKVHRMAQNFAEVENEFLELIEQTKKLGVAYRSNLLDHQHSLVHFYADRVGDPHLSQQTNCQELSVVLEKLLHNIIDSIKVEYHELGKIPVSQEPQIEICCLEKLRAIYEGNHQIGELEWILPRLREALRYDFNNSGGSGPTLKFDYHIKTARSFARVHQFKEAEDFLREIRSNFGESNIDYHILLLDFAQMYAAVGRSDDSKRCVKEAKESLQGRQHLGLDAVDITPNCSLSLDI